MFSFFHRTPTIHLDCFNHMADVYEACPIVKASKALPKWWKDLPPSRLDFNHETQENPRRFVNMRNCMGFLELYKNGVILESWSDYVIKSTQEDYQFFFSNGVAPTHHHKSEYGHAFSDYHHVKLMSPWLMREKTGVKWAWFGAEWSLEAYDFKVVTGIIRYDIACGTNVNLMVPKSGKTYEIRMGQPLVHIVPLTEKRLTVKNHLLSIEEYKKHAHHVTGTFYGWRHILDLKNRNKERGTCPFHNPEI